MNQLACLFRLAAMRRRAGAGIRQSLSWAVDLLWRDHQAGKRRQHIERRAEVERAARQRL
ncbi:hypothetical protein [Pantoea sp. 18069]|uniref:hypothetical protein n=1 Tax=Pantoea sp. 18069 TaxID=2681415 RepID=UPI001356AAC5|nr:hypothetical protein [Pantoea sp. 18069]